jgi:hypothetical protein
MISFLLDIGDVIKCNLINLTFVVNTVTSFRVPVTTWYNQDLETLV